MKTKFLLVVVCVLGLFIAGCGAAQMPAATLDVNTIVQQTFEAMTQQAGQSQPAATPIAPAATQVVSTPTLATGNISGNLNYPASSIPAMYVTAYQVGTQNYQFVITMAGQNTFQIDGLNPGTYHVVAYTVGSNGFPTAMPGGYTKAVPCGLSANCMDHTLIDVTVKAGQTTTDVNPFDWYAPQGTFPPFPQQGIFTTPTP